MFDCDPVKNPHAKLHRHLSYRQCQLEGLKFMDETATTLCKENNIPVIVFNLNSPGNILKALLGEDLGTTIDDDDSEDDQCDHNVSEQIQRAVQLQA